MKIRAATPDRVDFRNIDPGEVFTFDGCFYMKIDPKSFESNLEPHYNSAVCLSTGRLHYFNTEDRMIMVDGTFVQKGPEAEES